MYVVHPQVFIAKNFTKILLKCTEAEDCASNISSYIVHILLLSLSLVVSLSMVVLNSWDRQGKLWLPQFSHF